MSAIVARWLALASIAMALLGAACAIAAGRPSVLPAGPALVVLAPSAPSADDQASETYGDYADTLNSFAAHRPSGLKLMRMTPARWHRLVRRPLLADSYAVVFLRRDGRALLHDGMPVEAAVYEAGARWALGGAVPSADTGLAPATLVRR